MLISGLQHKVFNYAAGWIIISVLFYVSECCTLTEQQMLHINRTANGNKHSPPSAGSAEIKKEWKLYLTPPMCLSQRGRIKKAEMHCTCTLVENRPMSGMTDKK